MKIYKPEGLVRPNTIQTSKPAKPVRNDAFQHALQKAADPAPSSTQPPRVGGLPEPTPACLPNLAVPGMDLPEQLETALDRLERYSKALGDPRQSLKEIEPALLGLVAEAEALEKQYHQGLPADPALAEILEELLMTARTEYHKFQRGDYIDRY